MLDHCVVSIRSTRLRMVPSWYSASNPVLVLSGGLSTSSLRSSLITYIKLLTCPAITSSSHHTFSLSRVFSTSKKFSGSYLATTKSYNYGEKLSYSPANITKRSCLSSLFINASSF